MDLKERQGFAQDELVALDVREAEEWAGEASEEKEEKVEDFGEDNKWVVCHRCLQRTVSLCC
jgi:rhodanese-related sulfurtransferase